MKFLATAFGFIMGVFGFGIGMLLGLIVLASFSEYKEFPLSFFHIGFGIIVGIVFFKVLRDDLLKGGYDWS